MKYFPLLISLSIAFVFALYLTVYLHELGHSIVAFYYGCKENPFVVTITPTLINSNESPYNEGCWNSLQPLQHAAIASGGFASNILFGSLFLLLAKNEYPWKRKSGFNMILLFFFLLMGFFNFLHLVPYLIGGSFGRVWVENAEGLYNDVALIISTTKINQLLFPIIGIFVGILVWKTYKTLFGKFGQIYISSKVAVDSWERKFTYTYFLLILILTMAFLYFL